jgi:outer membrane protein OmpA-like peptidoglycan-associated protein
MTTSARIAIAPLLVGLLLRPSAAGADSSVPPSTSPLPAASAAAIYRASEGRIVPLLSVSFTRQGTVRPGPSRALQAIADVLVAMPGIKRVEIQSHVKTLRGDPQRNQELSERRAQSVMAWLVAHGIDAGRLTARGYGQTWPRDTRYHGGFYTATRLELRVLDLPPPRPLPSPSNP